MGSILTRSDRVFLHNNTPLLIKPGLTSSDERMKIPFHQIPNFDITIDNNYLLA